jgi:tetratricopeptide (TPR) repeat protein
MRELGVVEPRSLLRTTRGVAARVLFALAILLLPALSGVGQAQDVRADLSASVMNGYGRLIFTLGEELQTNVQVSNGILIIAFEKPIAISLDQIERKLPGFVQAARRDPDGTAVRISLSRKFTVNSMEAGEKLFIDLLPENWVGLPPGLPQDVVDELSRRARDAERTARSKRNLVTEADLATVRLSVAKAPNFSRFAFELSQPLPVTVERDGQEFRIQFDAPAKIDLGEARAALPPGVLALDLVFGERRSTVKLVLAPRSEVREFREDKSVVVDVTPPPVSGSTPPATLQDLAAAAEADAARERARDTADAEKEAAVAKAAEVQAQPPLAESAREDSAPAPLDLVTGPGGITNNTLVPIVGRQSGQFTITFAFSEPVPAAVFTRGDNIWLVFDTARAIDVSNIADEQTRIVAESQYLRSDSGAAVRIKLARTQLPSVERDGNAWRLILGDHVAVASRPMPLRRAPGNDERGAALVPLDTPGQIHRLEDPDVGDVIVVVTASPPARGILREQKFVEFRLLPSVHGLAVVPIADDLAVALSADGVTMRRPVGLAVSELPSAPPPPKEVTPRKTSALDVAAWKAEQKSNYAERESELIEAVSAAPAGQRAAGRIMLARFYLAHRFAAEAKGVLEAGVREDKELLNQPLYYLLRGAAELDLGRPDTALEYFTNTQLNEMPEAPLFRAIAKSDLGRWGETRELLQKGEAAISDLPTEYLRRLLLGTARAAVEVGDYTTATRYLHDLEVMEVPNGIEPAYILISGRVAEGIGRYERANTLYETIADLDAGPDAAEAKFRSVAMRYGRGALDRPKAIERLETLAILWRGDRIELETIRLLGRLFVAEARYRDAFKLLDAALVADPNSDSTHEFHGEMSAVFEDLFLTGKSDRLPPVEALALYYDFSRLTPIGRRGDELIRRLADRLVSVDLLDQAAELLDHQVNYRLTGAAKAQVAAKLAMIQLMNRKPSEAVRVLSSTRMPQLPQELREQRMFIEARALSEIGRHEAGAELITNVKGPEAERLRADIAWSSKNWREAGERLEKLIGDRWKGDAGFNATDRHDILRAALAYALGEETIGLARLKDKAGAKMGETPEGKVLALLVAKDGTNARTLTEAAKALASFDSLGTFVKQYRDRFPDRALPSDPMPTSAVKQRVSAR